ncbi:MAG: bestrophin family protein [Gammaproteobacteria bacterium]
MDKDGLAVLIFRRSQPGHPGFLYNREEHPGFFRGALAWHGSVTPRILPGVLAAVSYNWILLLITEHLYKLPHLDITPFEYTGAVLGLVLVFRTNAGHDRWWEARKLWGGIVNQSRNLLLMVWHYGPEDDRWRREMTKWISAFPFSLKEALRGQTKFAELSNLLNEEEIVELQQAQHMPMLVSGKVASLLESARKTHQLDVIVFAEFEKQRGLLIDYVGGCERILKTPMPLVYAIKTRRFILLYLLLLPVSLIDIGGAMSMFVTALVAYPLLSLDRIGLELQNPFAEQNLSHLPLEAICGTVLNNGKAMVRQVHRETF